MDKNFLAEELENLNESIRSLTNDEKNPILMDLLDRASTLVGTLILNFSAADENDIQRVRTLSKLCTYTIENLNNGSTMQNFGSIYDLVNSLEEDFREKKFLIGEDKEEKDVMNF